MNNVIFNMPDGVNVKSELSSHSNPMNIISSEHRSADTDSLVSFHGNN